MKRADLIESLGMLMLTFGVDGCSAPHEQDTVDWGRVRAELRVDNGDLAVGGTTTRVNYSLDCAGNKVKSGWLSVPLNGSTVSGSFGSVQPAHDCLLSLSTRHVTEADRASGLGRLRGDPRLRSFQQLLPASGQLAPWLLLRRRGRHQPVLGRVLRSDRRLRGRDRGCVSVGFFKPRHPDRHGKAERECFGGRAQHLDQLGPAGYLRG